MHCCAMSAAFRSDAMGPSSQIVVFRGLSYFVAVRERQKHPAVLSGVALGKTDVSLELGTRDKEQKKTCSSN